MHFFASCPPGVADLTAAELRTCGATDLSEFKLGVQFQGSLECAYRACLWSRTASRILLPLGTFTAATPEGLYEGVASIPWHEHIAPQGTLAVDFGGASAGITHTHFGALKTKDAIVDQLRARTGERPSVELEQPDVRIDVRVDRDRATVSLDLSGESLHRRGYRARGVAAPLKENLAAAVLLRSTWPAIAAQGGELLDPMCGSGTLLIEAALLALDVAPGSLRSHFGFIGWLGHDRALWQTLLEEAAARRAARAQSPVVCRGFDHDPAAVHASLENIERAGLRGVVHVERRSLEQLVRPAASGLLVVNPPYGERIGDQAQLQALYALLGRHLREQFEGWQAAVLTGNPPLAKLIGIKARRSHTLFNGRIECRLLRFQVQPGDYQRSVAPMVEPTPVDAATQRAEMLARPGAQMFANRLRKNLQGSLAWARRESVECYRLYDADMPEYAFAIDLYHDEGGQRHAFVQEYAAPRTVDRAAADTRRQEALAAIPEVLEVAIEHVHVRERRQQKGSTQYEKLAQDHEFHVVREGGHRLLVNFHDYLDTGLFLDHRLTRQRLGAMAAGKRFLNLFAYTGTATVYAAAGGASGSTTVDMSRTYLDWAKRNLALNSLAGPQHGFVQADCLTWLAQQEEDGHSYDLIFIDPPTHSRSKRLTRDFDVQYDHVRLLQLAAKRLTPRGIIVFSNNFARFRLDSAVHAAFEVQDIGPQTIPWDFRRSPRIHHCYVLQQRPAATLVDPPTSALRN
jgi:23S rRNA (guanine2445-N2)-methyltransferase / 23S rRNA (guanine2069-N7)-methyltransferase